MVGELSHHHGYRSMQYQQKKQVKANFQCLDKNTLSGINKTGDEPFYLRQMMSWLTIVTVIFDVLLNILGKRFTYPDTNFFKDHDLLGTEIT